MRVLLLAATALCAAACAPTYAPPVRAAHGGAPGHASPGESEVRGSLGAPAGLGGGLLLPLGGRTHLELGGEGADGWVLGTAGLRLTALEEPVGDDARLLGDVAFGLGIGRGGELCGNQPEGSDNCDGSAPEADGKKWHHRLAHGGYLTAGLAIELGGWFAPFVRGSMRIASATNVPLTFWLSGLAALEFRVAPVAFYIGGGWGGYTNEYDENHGPLLELGLAARFGGDG